MMKSAETINLFEDKLSSIFFVDEFNYNGRTLNLIVIDEEKKFQVTVDNISLFLYTDAHEIWSYWEFFRHQVRGSCLFEVPASDLHNYLTIADPFRAERSADARIFCLFANDIIFLMLFRLIPKYSICAID